MTANEKLQDLLLERSLILERIKGSVSNDLTKVYDELLKNISKRINESDLTIKQSERLIKLLEKDLVIPYAELGNDLNALAQDESKFMLNAVNVGFAAISKFHGDLTGQMFAFFIIAVAASEVAIGLGLLILWYKRTGSMNLDDIARMKG